MSLINLAELTPSLFPASENDEFEFKSSLMRPDEIKKELNKAASAFANSGGGCFIWGIDDKSGDPDGGVNTRVGKSEIPPWIDTVVYNVDPAPRYDVRLYEDNEGRGILNPDKVIVAVVVHPSVAGPHMAGDKKYYIRAGAHTVPATHFLVESIWARRQVSKPVISYVLRHKPHYTSVVQLGVIALTDAPALDVSISFSPLRKHMVEMFQDLPIQVAVIERSTPYYFDVTTMIDVVEELGPEVTLTIEYRDLMGNSYSYTNSAPLYKALPPFVIGIDDPLKKIAEAIKEVSQKLDKQTFQN